MKKLVFVWLMILSWQATFACDICGCAGSANYLGIVPLVQKNTLGLKGQHSSFQHPNTAENYNGTSRVLTDKYTDFTLWGRFFVGEKIQIFAFVPYKINTRVETERTTTIQGLGDVQAMLNYTFYQSADTAKWQHRLFGGANLGAPTGKFMQRDETKSMLPAYFQIGTGAWSYGANLNYTVRHKLMGLNLSGQYIYTAENELQYQFGQQWQGSATLFAWLDLGMATLLPQAGIVYDNLAVDTELENPVKATGAVRTSGILGADVYAGQWLFNASAQIPIWQDLPNAQPSIRTRFSVKVGYFF